MSTSLPIVWISFLDLQLQEILLCFPQLNPHGNKLARLSINYDVYLAYGIVKNAINGKAPFNPREFCSPFNLEFLCANFFCFSIEKQGNKSRSNYVWSKSIKLVTFFYYMGELTCNLPFKLGHALESIPRSVAWKVAHEKKKGEKAH